MQCVVREVARADVLPHVLFRPVEQRTDLPQTVALIPCDGFAERTFGRLLTPHACDPRLAARNRALERLDLANVAAGLPFFDAEIEPVDPVVAHILLDVTGVRIEHLDATLIPTLEAIEQRERFIVEPAGIEREHLDVRRVRRDDIGEHHRLRAETVRIDDVLVIMQSQLEQGASVLNQRLESRRQ